MQISRNKTCKMAGFCEKSWNEDLNFQNFKQFYNTLQINELYFCVFFIV